MIDTDKRDRVINGLECCNGEGLCIGKKCPYYEDKMCVETLHSDAIALLKAQEARVVAYDEIDNHEVLYLEVRDVETEDGLAPWVKIASGRWFSPLLCSETCPDMILSMPNEYGRICRCWTSRPTDAQREAVPWN